MSGPQRIVLGWMLSYPGVKVGWYGDADRPTWTAYWCDESARQHMVGVMADLGGDARFTAPRWKPATGATPRITKQTWRALLSRGLVQVVSRRKPAEGLSQMDYYQISPAGRRAFLSSGAKARGDGA